jgi:CheY-like chemotaxis protein
MAGFWQNVAEQPARPDIVTQPAVLIVDDNATERRLLSLLLARHAVDVIVAASGDEALAVIAAGQVSFDLILMDWQMYDMDGLECTRRIRQLEHATGRYTPIVGVTARVLLGDKQKCLQAGMDDYLSKPFTTKQFDAMVARWTKAKSRSAPAATPPVGSPINASASASFTG